MTKKELMGEAEMLQGNINRMMVTDDKSELLRMYAFALERLGLIYRERTFALMEAERKQDESRGVRMNETGGQPHDKREGDRHS